MKLYPELGNTPSHLELGDPIDMLLLLGSDKTVEIWKEQTSGYGSSLEVNEFLRDTFDIKEISSTAPFMDGDPYTFSLTVGDKWTHIKKIDIGDNGHIDIETRSGIVEEGELSSIMRLTKLIGVQPQKIQKMMTHNTGEETYRMSEGSESAEQVKEKLLNNLLTNIINRVTNQVIYNKLTYPQGQKLISLDDLLVGYEGVETFKNVLSQNNNHLNEVMQIVLGSITTSGLGEKSPKSITESLNTLKKWATATIQKNSKSSLAQKSGEKRIADIEGQLAKIDEKKMTNDSYYETILPLIKIVRKIDSNNSLQQINNIKEHIMKKIPIENRKR